METNSIIKNRLLKDSRSLVIIGVLALVLGIVALIYPASLGKITAVVIGVFLVIGGMIRLSFAFISSTIGSMILKYLYALLMVLAGVWIVMKPDMGLEALTIVMAVYFIIDGITAVIYSLALRAIGGGWFLLLSGIIGAVLGVMILSRWPESSNYVLGIYIGAKLVIDGLMLSLTGSAIRKAAS